MFTVKTFSNILASAALIASAASLSSCSNVIYDEPDSCEANHSLRFCWDHNMLFADAFKGNVSSVAVYGFDADSDKLAWVITDKGDALAKDGYVLSLNGVEPGEYTVVAWCGLDNNAGESESFFASDMKIGVSTRQELNCRMEREIRDDGSHHSSDDLFDLYHGTVSDVVIYDPMETNTEGDYVYTVNLKKDTNRVRIILQQLSGEDIEADKFTYTIEESNGWMAHDNELLDDEMITYHPHHQMEGIAGVDTDGTRAMTDVKVAIADLTLSRLMADRKTILTVRNSSNEEVVKIPLTDYALLVKDNYNKTMTEQEYLDRQDRYTLTFFLDQNHKWAAAQVIINSWRVVFNNSEFN